jgi:tetratricopeptide (TPR) repeat protein
MAVKQRRPNKPEQQEVYESPEALRERLSQGEAFLEKNLKWVILIGGIIALAVAGVFIYNYWQDRQNAKAQEEMFRAVFYFENENWERALSGDGNYPGFLEIIDNYGRTDAANLANYYAGIIYLRQGEYQSAIEHLDDFSSDDILVQARAYALQGDAHMELQQFDQAGKQYDKAADYRTNKFFTPQYLEKAALAYEQAGNNQAAVERYSKIIDNYYGANEYENARKQKARLEAMASK